MEEERKEPLLKESLSTRRVFVFLFLSSETSVRRDKLKLADSVTCFLRHPQLFLEISHGASKGMEGRGTFYGLLSL